MEHLIVFRQTIYDPAAGTTPPRDPDGNPLNTLIVNDQVIPDRHLRALRVTVDKTVDSGVTVIRGLQLHLEFLGNVASASDPQGNILAGEFVIIAQVTQVNATRTQKFFNYLEELKVKLAGAEPVVLITFKKNEDFN